MPKPRTAEVWMLRRPREPGEGLSDYIFLDEKHAREWMAQKLIAEDPRYVAEKWLVRYGRPCSSCGYRKPTPIKFAGEKIPTIRSRFLQVQGGDK